MTHPRKPLSLRARLIKTRGALLAVSLTLAGILLIALNSWLATLELQDWQWLHLLPLGELGGTFFGAGLLGTLFEYTFRRDQEAATLDQFREIIAEQAPAIRDAVIDGFAIAPADLKRVATPELLDTIAANAMALRLDDPQFAREIYASIRDQTIRASERWLDVDVNMRLSTMVERSASGASLLDVTVTVEYTTVPSHPVRRFVCTSDREEHNALRHDRPATSAWFMTPRPGIDAGSRENFELLSFTVDGVKRDIRRQTKRTAQTYAVDLTAEHAARQSVRIRQVYRTVTPAWGHRLFTELAQPSRNFSLNADYTNSPIANLHVTDTVATALPAQISRNPATTPGKVLDLEVPGWLLPRTGFTLIWTLESELPQDERPEAA